MVILFNSNFLLFFILFFPLSYLVSSKYTFLSFLFFSFFLFFFSSKHVYSSYLFHTLHLCLSKVKWITSKAPWNQKPKPNSKPFLSKKQQKSKNQKQDPQIFSIVPTIRTTSQKPTMIWSLNSTPNGFFLKTLFPYPLFSDLELIPLAESVSNIDLVYKGCTKQAFSDPIGVYS